MNATVQSIKNAVIKFQNGMAQRAATNNTIYEQIANDEWVEAGMHELKEPSTETFGGKIWHEFSTTKLYNRISEKQAFWVAIEFAYANGLDEEVVRKYRRN